MERREPTLSTGGISEQPEPRRQQSYGPDHDNQEPSRPVRRPTPQTNVAYSQPPSSSLPAIALVVALVAVGGAGFLGWQLFQAQAQLKQAEARILGLEEQLNLTSEKSSGSVIALEANLRKLDTEVRRLAGVTEEQKKGLAANSEKINAVGRDTVNAQKAANEAKAGLSALKQEVSTNKTVADAAIAKIDGMATSVSQQTRSLQNMKEELDKMALELTALDSIASRTKNNEEAISAIDDFRRSTNREILQIKQQLGTAPK